MKRKIVIILIQILFRLITSGYAINLQPSVIELSLFPGESRTGFYTVKNTTSNKIKIEVEPETYYGENVKKWFTITPKTFTLDIGKSIKVKYKISALKTLKTENCARIFFKQTPAHRKEVPGMGIVVRMGSSVYLSKKGNEKINPLFKKVKLINKNKDLTLAVDLKNNGNVHTRFYYTLKIYKHKETIYNITKHLTSIIPGASKKLSIPIKINSELKKGIYKAELKLLYGNVADNLKEKIFIFNIKI